MCDHTHVRTRCEAGRDHRGVVSLYVEATCDDCGAVLVPVVRTAAQVVTALRVDLAPLVPQTVGEA